MARKPSLSIESLAELGAEKLAALVLDETQGNAGFKRRVNAALAGKSGPMAIAKVIDRRLAGLDRARSFIDWDKARAFREDFKGLCDSIIKELAPADPALGLGRLLRFIATHDAVFQRVDDSSGRLQDVYWEAIEAVGPVAARLPAEAAANLSGHIMAALGDMEHGYLKPVSQRVMPHLSTEALACWDVDLVERITERDAAEAGQRASGRWFYSMTDQWREIRQLIAAQGGDMDQLIALELEKPDHRRDTLGIAAKLLDAGRATEALDWVRRADPAMNTLSPEFDLETDGGTDDASETAGESPIVRQAILEARILTALGRTAEAVAVRWDRFEKVLSPSLLREHLKALPDFEDMEAEDRAMAVALAHDNTMAALHFFLSWPRQDLAARLIIERHSGWDGQDWHILPKVADLLQHEHPLAASVLYRALLDDILARARSKAYSHGAKYLHRLDQLAAEAHTDPAPPEDFILHPAYREKLHADHGRKTGFWAQAGEPLAPSRDDAIRQGGKPRWVNET